MQPHLPARTRAPHALLQASLCCCPPRPPGAWFAPPPPPVTSLCGGESLDASPSLPAASIAPLRPPPSPRPKLHLSLDPPSISPPPLDRPPARTHPLPRTCGCGRAGGASLVSGAASKPAALCVSGAARKPRGERDSRRRFFSSCSQRYVAPAFPPPLPPPSGTGERPLLEDEGRPPPAPLARHMAWNGHLFCPVELV